APDGHDEVRPAHGGKLGQLVGEVLRSPVADDFQRALRAVLVAEQKVGDEEGRAGLEYRALAHEAPSRALSAELPGNRLFQAGGELWRRSPARPHPAPR